MRPAAQWISSSLIARLVLLVVITLAAGCTTLPVCTNGPGDKPGECVPWPKSPRSIGPQTA